jgi:asparagine synthase (glutamine-hydrolysing)
MCGLAGYAGLDVSRSEARALLEKAQIALRSRGPDGNGLWQAAGVGLAHTRLAVTAPSSGAQPLANEDGTIVAVVNGEFYGYEAQRAALIARGHQFATESDSEILLHLYEEEGTACVARLRGEFAFALWDARAQRLFAARDRFGIKPFCYTEQKGGLLFASEAKALFAMGVPAAWDREAFLNAAGAQYTLPDQTLFAGIRQLPAGYTLLWSRGGLALARYWDMDFPVEPVPDDPMKDAALIEECRARFAEAVALRRRADARVCCHLSGGLDSSSVAGVLARQDSTPAACFTVFFDVDAYNEGALAAETAQKLGASFYPVFAHAADILDVLPAAARAGEGLAINGHLSAKYLLNARIAAEGYKVALTGEGADEVLAGYPHLREDLWRSQGADSERIGALYRANGLVQGVQLPFGAGLSTEAVRRRLGFVPTFLAAKATLGRRVYNVLTDDARAVAVDPYATIIEALDVEGQLRGRSAVDQATYIWTKLTLANYILRTLGDGMEMAHGVEGRLPFLDHELFAFLRGLPLRLKINKGVEKYILREAEKDVLTPRVYARQKQSFMAPPLAVFADQTTRCRVRERFASLAFRQRTFFDPNALLALLDSAATASDAERTAAEPVLMMALTSFALAEAFDLTT